MLFTEATFAALVVGCWLSFVSVPVVRRSAVLALWGTAFYCVYAPRSAPLVFGLIVAVYLIPPRFWAVAAAISAGILAVYKLRTGPAPAIPVSATNLAGANPVLVPLGLSFLTFELIHFAVERSRGRLGDVGVADYLAFTLYFPCRLAGPIKRYPDFHAAVATASPSAATIYAGLTRVLIGVAKKVALADVLGLTVAEYAYAVSPLHVAKIVIAYSFELYLDFSAYSDIAIGVSRMLGIGVPENFRLPYLSESIQEFWTRWHISLSTWVRDYLFLPLGRRAFATRLRSKPMLIAALSYLVAFVVVGAWHGLTPNFLVWGAYHGGLLGAHHVYRRTLAERFAASAFYRSVPAKVISIAITFVAVTAGWILFLTPTLHDAARVLRLMIGRA